MLPEERSLLEDFKGESFAIVGVNGDSKDKLKELVKDGTTTWRNFTNKQEDGRVISKEWAVKAWPTIYILDHKGVIRHKAGLHGESLKKAIKDLIAEIK